MFVIPPPPPFRSPIPHAVHLSPSSYLPRLHDQGQGVLHDALHPARHGERIQGDAMNLSRRDQESSGIPHDVIYIQGDAGNLSRRIRSLLAFCMTSFPIVSFRLSFWEFYCLYMYYQMDESNLRPCGGYGGGAILVFSQR